MVETILTKEMIETGATVVRKLDEGGLQPDAALWFYFPDVQQWKLVIAEEKVNDDGPKKVYKKIQQILIESADEIAVSLDDVVLAKPDAPIIGLLRMALRADPNISGLRFQNNVVDGTLIDDTYIYRLN